MDFFSSAAATEGGFQTLARLNSNDRSPAIPGASQHSAIFSAYPTSFHDDLLSFVSYIKSRQIPVFSVALPDVRSVLGRGASFFVNGAEMPETCVDEVTGELFEKGSIVALKRAVVPPGTRNIQDGLTKRIGLLFNEVLTMRHPPLAAHPNIVQLLGIAFEVEGHESDQNVMPVLVPECAQIGNLAEVLETAKREGRPLSFDQKLAFCVDIAHGLEALHACDIIHGDVKCENVLVFEVANSDELAKHPLICKLTDFGFSHLDASSHGFPLGGSPPWQAPELISGKYFKIESAKRTDIYSFGLLVWRLMLDGDPFEPLESFEGETEREKRVRRNENLASLKDEDELTEHVCDSMKSSNTLDERQLRTIFPVIRSTLAKNPSQRELCMANLIRLLDPDFWYKSRQLVEPERISFPRDIKLLDVEKYFHELRKADGAVKEKIAHSFYDYAKGLAGDRSQNAGAAYQLAVCHAIGFGVPFEPRDSVKWLEIAAMGGSQSAQLALPRFRQVFDDDLKDYVIPSEAMDNMSLESLGSPNAELPILEGYLDVKDPNIEFRDGKLFVHGKVNDGKVLLLEAAELCQYGTIELLLSHGVPGNASTEEGVTALHFLSAWDKERARDIGRKLIQGGADINANARKGNSVGGTPLMWSVREDRLEHSLIILGLGGSPTAVDILGLCALSLCASMHLYTHLGLLLKYTMPVEVEEWLYRLIVAAASGESRFSHIVRHGNNWQNVPQQTLKILQAWHGIFPDVPEFNTMLLSALKESLNSAFGPSNTNIQILYLDTCSISPNDCTPLLAESIITDNQGMFDLLIARKVPATGHFTNQKTLLHLCAQNPNNTTTVRYFGQQLLKQPNIDINARDFTGQTPFMDALLARKWDLAYLLIHNGADPLATTNAGYTVLGLIIRTLNLGAAKWAFKYSGAGDVFRQKGFIVHPGRNISAIQEAARLKLPRAHGMKTEVSGLFLFILANFMTTPENIDFRSDGILPNASALDIAAVNGNVHAVKALVKKGADHASGESALGLARRELEGCEGFLERKGLERCIFIIERWEGNPRGTERVADGWTKLRTIDESNVRSSWEVVAWEWKLPNRAK